MTARTLIAVGTAALVAALISSATAPARAQAPSSVVNYTAAGELLKPADFREWVFLSSGIGMAYTPPAPAKDGKERPPAFTNVYVNPASYRTFMKTGRWPDKTMFVLEARASTSVGSINVAGRYQTDMLAIEAEVKDSALPGGWGFFNFGPTADKVAPLARTADCYECHSKHGAVEWTFVQFYPTLLDVARTLGTVNAGYVPDHKE